MSEGMKVIEGGSHSRSVSEYSLIDGPLDDEIKFPVATGTKLWLRQQANSIGVPLTEYMRRLVLIHRYQSEEEVKRRAGRGHIVSKVTSAL